VIIAEGTGQVVCTQHICPEAEGKLGPVVTTQPLYMPLFYLAAQHAAMLYTILMLLILAVLVGEQLAH